MTLSERELLVSRILAGKIRLKLDSLTLVFANPTREARYIANEVYQDIFEEAEYLGLYSDEELLQFLYENDIWSLGKQERLDGLQKDINEIKIKLYQIVFRSNDLRIIRSKLKEAKDEVEELYAGRHSYDWLSCSGVALLAKAKYFLASGLTYLDGSSLYEPGSFWNTPDSILDTALDYFNRLRLSESDVREVSRTEPWRIYWNARKADGMLFGCPAADLNEEQRNVISWSLMYDNIQEHPECPPDSIVEDDDILDGWLLLQRKNREGRLEKKRADNLLQNEKIKKSDEVYLPAQSLSDAKKITAMNEPAAEMVRRHRMATLHKKGTMSELEMPDTQQKLQIAVTEHLSKAMKKTRNG